MWGKERPSFPVGGLQTGTGTLEISIKNSQNSEVDLLYGPDILLLGIYTSHSTEIGSAMFVAALVTVARKWEQPKCPSTDEG